MSDGLKEGDIADVWHEGTKQFYQAKILGPAFFPKKFAVTQPAQPVVNALDKAVKAIYAMTDTLRPPPAGSFAHGEHAGICAAARTVADMRDKARAAPQPAPAAERSTADAPTREDGDGRKTASDVHTSATLSMEECDAIARRCPVPVGMDEDRDRWLIRAGRATVAEDAARYRWLRERYFGVDFCFFDTGSGALHFEWPKGCAIGANLDAAIDAARGKP